ncbi:hypothetical protein Tco_1472833, partial [Tanacetum coccineum]
SSEAPSLAKRPKAGKVIKKRKPKSSSQLIDEGVPDKEPVYGDEEADTQREIKESLKEVHDAHRGHDESSSLYAELGLTDSETESDEEVPGIDAGDQDEGQAGPNPGIQDEGQAGSNLGDAIENLKLLTKDQVRLEEPSSSAGTLSSLLNLDKEISFADQFLVEKSQEGKPEKTNTESEVQSIVMFPIHQDTSFVPLMTTPVIDLTVSQTVSITVQAPLPTSTSTRIGELEQHMADLVSKAVDEIFMDVVDWAIQAPLRDRFRDLPEAEMKEILHHRMWETKSYEAHEDHKKLYEALEKLKPSVSSIPEDLHMDADLAPDEHVCSSDDEDIRNAHIPKASALASTYAPPSENSLLAQTGDMAIFMDWFCKKQRITKLTQKDLEGPAFEIVKVFHPSVIHLHYQMEECHKLLTDKVDDYLRYGSKGGRPGLSISKMKAAYYTDVGLEQMVPDQ